MDEQSPDLTAGEAVRRLQKECLGLSEYAALKVLQMITQILVDTGSDDRAAAQAEFEKRMQEAVEQGEQWAVEAVVASILTREMRGES